jgi:hypothetical protein
LSDGVSWDDSATLLALAKAFAMLGSCNSCKKTPCENHNLTETELG